MHVTQWNSVNKCGEMHINGIKFGRVCEFSAFVLWIGVCPLPVRGREGSSVGGRVARQRFEQGSVVWGPVSGAARGSARVGPPWQLRGALILMGTNRTVLYPFFFSYTKHYVHMFFYWNEKSPIYSHIKENVFTFYYN